MVKRLIFACLICSTTLQAQNLLEEMEIEDISGWPEVRSKILRRPGEALLIVRSIIPEVQFRSTREIIAIRAVEPGTWHLRLKPGTHRISFLAPGFLSAQKRLHFADRSVRGLMIRPKIGQPIRADSLAAFLRIQSEPQGADVFVDDRLSGFTPFAARIDPGRHKLTLKNEDYEPAERWIVVDSAQTYEAMIPLVPRFGTVYIDAPLRATIVINGDSVGTGPMLQKLAGGRYVIAARRHGSQSDVDTIEVNPGAEIEVQLRPVPLTGKLHIDLQPRKAVPASLYVDGKPRGTAPGEITGLLPGRHLVEIKKSGFQPYRQEVDIPPQKGLALAVTLEKVRKLARAAPNPWKRRRNLTLLGTGALLASGFAFKSKADQEFENYEAAQSSAEAQSKRKNVEKWDKFATGAFIGAGVFAVWSIYNQFKSSATMKRYRENRVQFRLEENGFSLSIEF